MDQNKPHIIVERGVTYAAIRFVIPGVSKLGVVVEQTPENAAALEYMAERLKDSLNF
jgi:hypothetical protein